MHTHTHDTQTQFSVSVITDKKFLAFFFKRLKVNSTDRYRDDFPFISPCGRELNYIRCDDVPLVITHLLDSEGEVIQDIQSHASTPSTQGGKNIDIEGAEGEREGERIRETELTRELLSYGGTGNLLTVPFQPERLYMLPESGRIYHSAPLAVGGVGLVKSSLAIELSRHFWYEEGSDPEAAAPVGFSWRGKSYTLDNYVAPHLKAIHR